MKPTPGVPVDWLAPIRRQLRANRGWVALRRWQREGLLRAYRRAGLWRRVLSTPPVRTAPRSPAAVEVHLACYGLDYLPAIWALKSFYWSAQVDWPLVIHFNESARPTPLRRLRRHFPDATLILRDAADQVVEPRLMTLGLTRLLTARRASPFMIKLIDFPLLAQGKTILGLDSDVLFFARPTELLERCASPERGYTFQRDPANAYNIEPEEAVRRLGIPLASRVNTGIIVCPTDLPDPVVFEQYLADPDIARTTGFIEQTLYALHASAIGAIAYLSADYLIDLHPGVSYDGLIARHYAGGTRPLLTAEGMPRVLESPWFSTA